MKNTPLNSIFIATSLDGYIADRNNRIDYLSQFPNPNKDDLGYADFMKNIDAILMGRKTFEMVCSFDIEWPYEKAVFVLSNRMKVIPQPYSSHARLISGAPKKVLADIHLMGYRRFYIDGGKTIQSFLQEDLIDEMIITQIPVLLGGGTSLFGELKIPLWFECHHTEIFLNKIVQNHYRRDNRTAG